MMHLKIRYFLKNKLLLIVVTTILCFTSGWLIMGPFNKLLNNFLLYSDFKPKIFNIVGNKIILKEDILEVIYELIENTDCPEKCSPKWNILYISPWKIRKTLKERFNWIKDITVIRQVPDTFTIFIKEYVPFAIWNNKVILDIDGNKIDDKQFISKMGNNLIQVKSNSIDTFMLFISSIKENNELINNIKSLEYINNRRWNLILKSGLIIKLPESDPEFILLKLIKSDKRVLTSKDIKVIDVRIKNKTFITE